MAPRARPTLHRFDVTCTRCAYAWRTKPCPRDELPARCPRCHSIYWKRRAAALGVMTPDVKRGR